MDVVMTEARVVGREVTGSGGELGPRSRHEWPEEGRGSVGEG